MFKKFLIWLVKNLLVLLLSTFIFSTVALDLPDMVKGVFRDVFLYANPEAQNEAIGKLTVACSALDGKDISGLRPAPGMPFDFGKIGSLCRDYNSKKINGHEFFFSVIGSAIPEKLELPNAGAFEKYNSIMEFLNKNKAYYVVILLALLSLLYLLAGNLSNFLAILSGISLSMGILILLPYAAIIAYEKFVGFDTTPVLSSILQGSFSFEPKAIISVVLLMILRTYTSFIVTLGVVFLGAGIAGKVYIRILNKAAKPEPRADKKPKKKAEEEKSEKPKEKLAKEEEEEAYKHRDKSTKEILDELDEMHRKKQKEKESEK